VARPKKQTVDYFPHDCVGSKSLSIVQTQHGNDGYAFWFKLLQLLGKTEGHSFDYNDEDSWLFLLTETHVPDEKARSILETLASVGSIDKALWKKKIIWSQHFVDNVADVYMRRKVGLPTRPGSPLPKPAIREKIIADNGDKVAGMIALYEEELGKMLTPPEFESLKDYADTYPDGYFERAIAEVKAKKNVKSPVNYIGKVMENWLKDEEPAPASENHQGFKSI